MILDTCALLWLAGGDPGRISEETLNLINKATDVSIVAITGFEIGVKHRAGKLILPVKPQEWMDSILDFHKIGIINLDLELCSRAADLPPIHKDPCDRLIICAALRNSLPVVTADKRFVEYGVRVLS